MKIIHVQWDGPYDYEEAEGLNNKNYDYGVYQVYGSHPVYGSDVLVYIDWQTTGHSVRDLGTETILRLFVLGKTAGTSVTMLVAWRAARFRTTKLGPKRFSIVEKLLIYSHRPAANSQNIRSIPGATELEDVHILNWGNRRDLLYEVSGRTMTSRYDDIKRYRCYGDPGNELEV